MDHINHVISLQQLNEGVKKRYLRQRLFPSAKSIFNNLNRFLLSTLIFDDETYKNMYAYLHPQIPIEDQQIWALAHQK